MSQYNNANELIAYSEGQPSGTACTAPSSGRVLLTYDGLGRLERTNFSDATPDIYSIYDDNGNLTRLTRGAAVWNYAYHDNDSLKEERLSIDGLQFDTQYSVNRYGNVDAITYPSGDELTLEPDALGRPSRLTSINTEWEQVYAQNVQYHASQSLKSFQYGNGITFEQNLNSRLLPSTREVFSGSGGSRNDIVDYAYTYDNRGNTTRITDYTDTSRTINNTFDGLSRLKTSESAFGDITFNYDALGNLRKRTVSGGNAFGGAQHNATMGFNSTNRITSATTSKGVQTYNYDNRGNVTRMGDTRFTYDQANQPISVTGSQDGEFVYDGNLKRIKKTTDEQTTYFIYTQGAGLVSQYNKTTQVHTDYIRLGGQTIAQVESGGSEADTSTVPFNGALPERSETALAGKDYYLPYGQSVSGNAPSDNAIGFTGHIKDGSGLTYMEARFYDPVSGRFLSNDPLPYRDIFSFNRYSYANNNPYRYTDPTGLDSEGTPEEDDEHIVDAANDQKNERRGSSAGIVSTASVFIGGPGVGSGSVSSTNSSAQGGTTASALPSGMRTKSSKVKIDNLDSKLAVQLDKVVSSFRAHGISRDVVITSGNDSAHSQNSLHFADKAIDVRSNFLTDTSQLSLANSIQVKLGKDFTVISEHFNNKSNNHIHIEVDVTQDASRASVYKQRGFNRNF